MVEYKKTKWDELDQADGAEQAAPSVSRAHFYEQTELSDDSAAAVSDARSANQHSKTAQPHGTARKKTRRFAKLVSLVLAAALLAGVTFGVGYGVGYHLSAGDRTDQLATDGAYYIEARQINNASLQDDINGIPDLVKKLGPNVVAITNRAVTRSQYFGIRQVEGSGTGVVFNVNEQSVLIVTNNHVVENAAELLVAFDDGKTVPAKLIGRDATADLAVIEVSKENIAEDVLATVDGVVFADSDQLQVGEMAIAIGNPLGYDDTVTVGFVSGLDRELTTENGRTLKLIQTDAAINPGNSGGALINTRGELIGINTVKITNTGSGDSFFATNSGVNVEGIGFAIPINVVKPIIEDILHPESHDPDSQTEIFEGTGQAYIGIYDPLTVDRQTANDYNLSVGVFISAIAPGSGAEKAGLQRGDIIVEIDNNRIETTQDLYDILETKKPNDVIKMTIDRNHSINIVEVTLSERTDIQ